MHITMYKQTHVERDVCVMCTYIIHICEKIDRYVYICIYIYICIHMSGL